VDNASSDGSGDRLHKEFPTIQYFRSKENLGFAEGNNVGIRLALKHGADYVALLNNDTVVDSKIVEALLDCAEGAPGIGVQSGKIYFFSDRTKIWYAGGVLNIPRGLGTHRGLNEEDLGQYDNVNETGFATGCLMFFSRKALEDVGLLDSRFFLYCEDCDWCIRARRKGYRIVYNPKAVVWHKVSSTSTIDSLFYLYFTMRNKLLLVRKHVRTSEWLPQVPYFCYFYGRQLIRMSMKWHSWKGTQAIWYGLVDGLRGYTGDNGKGRIEAVTK
jgi:hypothetical protein